MDVCFVCKQSLNEGVVKTVKETDVRSKNSSQKISDIDKALECIYAYLSEHPDECQFKLSDHLKECNSVPGAQLKIGCK